MMKPNLGLSTESLGELGTVAIQLTCLSGEAAPDTGTAVMLLEAGARYQWAGQLCLPSAWHLE